MLRSAVSCKLTNVSDEHGALQHPEDNLHLRTGHRENLICHLLQIWFTKNLFLGDDIQLTWGAAKDESLMHEA
jgi:hypothetical protein